MIVSVAPTQTRIPIPPTPLPVDPFPSFIVIASPSVFATMLTLTPPFRSEWESPFMGQSGPFFAAIDSAAIDSRAAKPATD
jgi:hypothetical protein